MEERREMDDVSTPAGVRYETVSQAGDGHADMGGDSVKGIFGGISHSSQPGVMGLDAPDTADSIDGVEHSNAGDEAPL